jgi:hypothetical protein
MNLLEVFTQSNWIGKTKNCFSCIKPSAEFLFAFIPYNSIAQEDSLTDWLTDSMWESPFSEAKSRSASQ